MSMCLGKVLAGMSKLTVGAKAYQECQPLRHLPLALAPQYLRSSVNGAKWCEVLQSVRSGAGKLTATAMETVLTFQSVAQTSACPLDWKDTINEHHFAGRDAAHFGIHIFGRASIAQNLGSCWDKRRPGSTCTTSCIILDNVVAGPRWTQVGTIWSCG